jgi:hypothetical protein
MYRISVMVLKLWFMSQNLNSSDKIELPLGVIYKYCKIRSV